MRLCHLQDWVKAKGLRVVILFEGRDAAGKGGTIKALHRARQPTDLSGHRAAGALGSGKEPDVPAALYAAPPAAGEVVIFDRNWYNRAGVEHVMGFCTDAQCDRFLKLCPLFERHMVEGGLILIKFWLEVSNKGRQRRFRA